MELSNKLILRGLGIGALGGLLAWIFARIFAEPYIQRAIDYESGRDAAMDALRRAAGLAVEAAGSDPFTRGVQRNVGITVGMLVFGLAVGGVFAVVYYLVHRRVGSSMGPRMLAMLLAAAAFISVYVVPFIKYPANPPAIGHEETIGVRTALYLAMVVVSVVGLTLCVLLAVRLKKRLGGWNATLVSGLVYIAIVAIAMAILPPLGHIHANVVEYGRQATETPLPLTNSDGQIVYAGFPADVLFKFRLYSMIAQFILWGTIGFGFGALAERVLVRERRRQEIALPASGVTPPA